LDSRPFESCQWRAPTPGGVNNSTDRVKGTTEEAEEARPQPADTFERGGTSRVVVLVVDDDDFMREVTTDILTGLGYDVLQASDGDAALEAFNNGSIIDVLLADVVMNGMSGPELAHQVRALHPSMPIVFMSGYADLANGGGDQRLHQLIRKPFRPNDLRLHIETALPQSRRIIKSAAPIFDE